MNQILYEIKCKCKEDISFTKRYQSISRSEGKPIPYPDMDELNSKIFHLKYKEKLSSVTKFLLKNFQNKYLYYAIDDILYSLKFNKKEQDKLLELLYSPVLLLQNSLSVNFFDIWIHEIYINDDIKINKFLTNEDSNLQSFNYITIKLLYRTKISLKNQESLW